MVKNNNKIKMIMELCLDFKYNVKKKKQKKVNEVIYIA